MKSTCRIEKTVQALEEAIRNKEMAETSTPPHVSAMSSLILGLLSKYGLTSGQARQLVDRGQKWASHMVHKIGGIVRRKPWEAAGQVAICSFALGFILSARHRKPARNMR